MNKGTADILLGLTGGLLALSSRSGGFNDDAFWSWFGNSKVVDENDEPLVVYHGSQGRRVPDTFYLTITRRAPGFFFTSSYENALEYAKQPLKTKKAKANAYKKIVSAYLSFQKPLIIGKASWKESPPNWDEIPAGTYYIEDEDGGLEFWDLVVPENIRRSPVDNTMSTDDVVKLPSVQKMLKDGKIDSIIFKDICDSGGPGWLKPTNVYVAFRSNQIKSIHNHGTWDSDSDNISFNRIGE